MDDRDIDRENQSFLLTKGNLLPVSYQSFSKYCTYISKYISTYICRHHPSFYRSDSGHIKARYLPPATFTCHVLETAA